MGENVLSDLRLEGVCVRGRGEGGGKEGTMCAVWRWVSCVG